MEIADILDQVDIVELASHYTDLEERGGEWWGISPITYPPENTPSFSCRRETGQFYDFSSGVGGSAITLIQACEGVTAAQAIQKLKKYLGVDEIGCAVPKKLLATNICNHFRSNERRKKQSTSKILPADYMDRYEWREDKFTSWLDEGITVEAMKKFQVRYDAFSDRIVHPIRDVNGNIINVCGRTLDPLYKEHRLRKYTYFKPLGALDTLYGLSDNIESIKKQREIIVFEGAKSVMKAYGWGITNAVAILTSHVNDFQFNILAKLGVRTVFALDSDIDIREDKNIMRLKPYTRIEWITDWEDLLDPKDAPVDKGKEIFMHLYEQRIKFR